MVDTKPCPGEASKSKSQGEEDCGGSSGHDQGSQKHEHGLFEIVRSCVKKSETNLSKVRATCEQLPNVGGRELPVSTERVGQVTTYLKSKGYDRS